MDPATSCILGSVGRIKSRLIDGRRSYICPPQKMVKELSIINHYKLNYCYARQRASLVLLS